jgi:hypothetical protein
MIDGPRQGIACQQSTQHPTQSRRIQVVRKGLILLAGLSIAHGLYAAPAASAEHSTKYDVRLVPGQGIVALRVVANRPVGGFFAKLGVLIVKNQQTGKTFRVRDNAPSYASFSMFVAALPEGTYEMDTFENAAGGGWISITQDSEVGPTAGSFQIGGGRITDLGTMAYVKNIDPSDVREYKLAFDEQERATAYSRALWAEPIVVALDKGLLGWQPASPGQRPPLKPEQLAGERNLVDPSADANGVLRYGAPFGQILSRTTDGRWSREKLPTLHQISDVATLKDGTIIAAADEGLIFVRAPGGAWVLKPVAASARPEFVRAQESGGIFLVAELADAAVVYHAANVTSTWDEIRRIPLGDLQHLPRTHIKGAILNSDQFFVTTVKYGFVRPDHTVSALTLATQQWTSNPVPFGAGIISPLPGGGIYGMFGRWIDQSLGVSLDNGRTWDKRGSPNHANQPVFRSSELGYLTTIDRVLKPDGSRFTASLWKTLDGGRSWQRHADIPDQSSQLVLLPGEGHLLLQTSTSEAYSTVDDGKTWARE